MNRIPENHSRGMALRPGVILICISVVPLANADDGLQSNVDQEITVLDRSPEKIEQLKRDLDAKLAQLQKEIDEILAECKISDITDIDKLTDGQITALDKKMDMYSEIALQRSRLDGEIYTERTASTRSTPIVTLGGGEYMNYANFGGGGSGKSGFPHWCIGTWDYGYNVNYRKAESVSKLFAGSWGDCWAYGQIGQDFIVSGPYGASDMANIRVAGRSIYEHAITGAGSASIDVDLHLLDVTEGTEFVTNIWDNSINGPFVVPERFQRTFNRSMSVLLKAGHYYKAWVEVRTEADADTTATYTEYDCGPQDKDGGDYTQYDYIWITF